MPALIHLLIPHHSSFPGMGKAHFCINRGTGILGHIARCLLDSSERSSRFLRKPGFQCFSLLRFRWLGPNSQFIRSYAYKESPSLQDPPPLQESPTPPRIPLPRREGLGEGAAAQRIPTPPKIPHTSKNPLTSKNSPPLEGGARGGGSSPKNPPHLQESPTPPRIPHSSKNPLTSKNPPPPEGGARGGGAQP